MINKFKYKNTVAQEDKSSITYNNIENKEEI